MAKEGTGFNLKVSFNGTEVCAKTKKLPKYTQDDKVDVSTDCIENGLREFIQGDLYKIEDFEFTTPLDLQAADAFRIDMRDKVTGNLIVQSTLTNTTLTIPNAFIVGVDMGSADIGSATEMTITVGFGGGANGEPTVAV